MSRGLYLLQWVCTPSTAVDRAIYGRKFRAQKHEGTRSSNQMALIEL